MSAIDANDSSRWMIQLTQEEMDAFHDVLENETPLKELDGEQLAGRVHILERMLRECRTEQEMRKSSPGPTPTIPHSDATIDQTVAFLSEKLDEARQEQSRRIVASDPSCRFQ